MKTIQVKKQVQDDTKHAEEWLESEYPNGIDLYFVDYRESLDEHGDALQELLQNGYSETIDEWYRYSDYFPEGEIVAEYEKEHECEVSEEVREFIVEWAREHDTSNVQRDLLKNTRAQLFFIETGEQMHVNEENAELVEKYADNEDRKKELATLMREQFYDAPVGFYFYAEPLALYNALWKEEGNDYIHVDGVYMGNVDRGQGSNWLGENAVFNIAIPRDTFLAGTVCTDKGGYGYSWDSIAGATGYEECGIFTEGYQRPDYVLIAGEVSEEAKREVELQKHWDATRECTAGDMNYSRHKSSDQEYRNDYPCGTKCKKCGTFWID